MIRHIRDRIRAGIFAGLGLLPVLGCGEDDGIGKRYPVSGTVTYMGQPVPHGTVNFTPDGPEGRNAAGDVRAGSFTATTLTPGDGMFPGKYKVSINAIETDLTKVMTKTGGIYRSDLIAKAPKKRLVPKKYESTAKSGLSAEVKPETNTFRFDLED